MAYPDDRQAPSLLKDGQTAPAPSHYALLLRRLSGDRSFSPGIYRLVRYADNEKLPELDQRIA